MISYSSTLLPTSRIQQIIQSNWFALFFVLFLSVLLALVNHSWIFQNPGWLDPWYNVGYGYTFDDPKFGGELKRGYYKISRIPWLYVQYVFRKFFSPLVASYFLQYSCLFTSVMAVYFTVRRLLGYVPALLAATILCVYPEFLGSGGGDYQNSLACALYALCFLVLTIAAQSDKKTVQWLIFFGCIYATLIHTVVLYLNFLPVLLFHFYFVRQTFGKITVPFRNIFASFLLGGALSTCFWGLVSKAYGYKFLFFMTQKGLLETFLFGQWMASPWWRSWSSGWLFEASWMGPLTAAMVFSIGSIIFSYKRRKNNTADSLAYNFNLQFVFLGSLWLLWQVTKKDMLNTPYFASLLIIPFVMSVVANFKLYVRDHSSNLYVPMILGLTTVVFLCFDLHLFVHQYVPITVFILTLCCFFITFILYKVHVIASMICLGFACSIPWHMKESSFSVRDSYLAIVEASRWIYTARGSAKEVFVWFDESNVQNRSPALNQISYSLVCAGLLGYLQAPFPMPSIQNLNLEEVKGHLSRQKTKVVVLVTEDAKHVDEMRSRLDQIDIHLDLAQVHEVRVGDIHIPMYVLKESSLQIPAL